MAHAETFARLGGEVASLARELLDDGDLLTVDDGARGFEVLHTPGHASGHLCLLETEGSTLLGGDMAPGLGTTLIDPDEGSMAVYLQQLRRLAERAPARVLPAHGPALVPGGAALEALIAHREAREEKVIAALGPRPQSLEAVARRAYADLPPQFAGLGQRSTLAHLEKLRVEGLAEGLGEQGWRLREGSGGASKL